ncbi:sulfite exporter TauE/SafE family protein, partial [Acidisphaera rubrifaciens]|uniref:sulfite exporter TauE/SafE family protein n=1 Tax=Acidisphaera rubrifaciens TaxID=50715 RepID=UPI0006624F81
LLRPWIARRLAARPLPAGGTRRRAALTVATGLALGVLVTLSSVGAGAIGLTVLALLHPRLPIARLVGSDIAHAVPLTLIAGLGHWAIGDVDPRLLASLLCGSIPAVLAGSVLATRVPERALRPALAVILLATAARLFV